MPTVDGYSTTSYGDGFADVYDEWYHDVTDVGATVAALVELTSGSADHRVLELGVGTGRLAIPLARADLTVHGVDASASMLERLGANDPDGLVTTHLGDMVDGLPGGPYDLVLVAYNTLFNLVEPGRQAACFVSVAERLAPGGRFVVEAFVPDEIERARQDVSVRSLATDRVVLSVSVHDPANRTASGQFVELTESGGVRLRPWMVRYSTIAELDAMAHDVGFELEHRWTSFDDRTFDDDSERHVSVYRLRTA